MPDDLRVRHLVEEILESKRTPEEVCSGTPDLLPAALAGAGLGDDAGKLSETERAELRKQAYGWLADELASLDKQLQGASVESRDALMRFLKQWQTNPDLTGLRESSALKRCLQPNARSAASSGVKSRT